MIQGDLFSGWFPKQTPIVCIGGGGGGGGGVLVALTSLLIICVFKKEYLYTSGGNQGQTGQGLSSDVYLK